MITKATGLCVDKLVYRLFNESMNYPSKLIISRVDEYLGLLVTASTTLGIQGECSDSSWGQTIR
jgi:hypothetical protein